MVNSATNSVGCSQDFQNGTLESSRDNSSLGGSHCARDVNDGFKGDVATVLDVLNLLAVANGLLQSLNYQSSGGGHNFTCNLSVLNAETDGDLNSLPGSSSFGNLSTSL